MRGFANEGGRADALLGSVVDLQAAAAGTGRLQTDLRIGQRFIQNAGGHPFGVLSIGGFHRVQHSIHPLAGQGGEEQHRRVAHELQVGKDLLAHGFHGVGVLFDRVPLVDDHDDRLAGIEDQSGHLGILFGHAGLGVDQQQGHVAAVDGGDGAQHAVAFQCFILHRLFLAHSGGINDVDAGAVRIGKEGVNRVPGGAGNVADHGALLPQQLVGQGALAHVGAAHQRQLDHVFSLFFLVGLSRGQMADDGLQQVAQPQHVGGADGNGIAQTKVVVFVQLVVQARVVHLIDHQQNGLVSLAQVMTDVLVIRGQAGTAIAEKADHVRRFHGDLRLPPHLGKQHVLAAHIQTAGIHHAEMTAHPLHVAVDAVAGHAGHILHDGDAPSGHLIEESRFAHIGPANNGN